MSPGRGPLAACAVVTTLAATSLLGLLLSSPLHADPSDTHHPEATDSSTSVGKTVSPRDAPFWVQRDRSNDADQSMSTCGWWMSGVRSDVQTGASGETDSNIRGNLNGWSIRASRVSVLGMALPGIVSGPALDWCRLSATGRIRILAPDGRYITGESLSARGSPAWTLAVWSGHGPDASASIVGDGWRLHGKAVFIDISTGTVRVIEPAT
jgi:hypothetical protein